MSRVEKLAVLMPFNDGGNHLRHSSARRTAYRISPVHYAETLWSGFALGRRLVQFGTRPACR